MNNHKIKKFIEEMLVRLGIEFDSIECEKNKEQEVFQIYTKESLKLTGSRGETIRALNHIAKRMTTEENEKLHFIIDVNGYRVKKIQELEQTAKLLAERARSLKYNVEMTPMSSYERMIVHSALSDELNIKTESKGYGRDRRVVICFVE